MRKTNHKTNKKRGFTLIELLIYMGILALFLTAASYSLIDIVLGSVKSSVQQEVQENLRFASKRIEVEVRNSLSINEGASSFASNLAQNPSQKVSFSAPSPYNPLEFRVREGVLEIRTGDDNGNGQDEDSEWDPLTSFALEVTNLTFRNLSDQGSENVSFSLTLRYKNPSGRSEWEKEASFEGGAALR